MVNKSYMNFKSWYVVLCSEIKALPHRHLLQESELLRPGVLNTQTPDGPAYGTSDLFLAHPTKQGLFKM